MKKVAIIQARMNSTRLPGKVLRKINGVTILGFQVNRIKKSKLIDQLLIATSTSKSDDVIADFCMDNEITCFRGSEDDVLDRYYNCAKEYDAEIVIRFCSDNPLIDPIVIDKVIQFYIDSGVDYASNGTPPEKTTFPDGADLEVFSMTALEKTHKNTTDLHDREHVTFHMWKYDNGYSLAQYHQKVNQSEYRFTLDYPEDFEVVEFIITELFKRNSFGNLEEIVEILKLNPEIKKKNAHYYYGIGWKNRSQVK